MTFYTTVDTLPVPCEDIASVNDTVVGINSQLPSALVEIIEQACVGNYNEHEFHISAPDGQIFKLRRLSDRHGRSFEILPDNEIWFVDEYGNLFHALNTKGNDFSRLQLEIFRGRNVGDIEWRVVGMHEERSLRRLLVSSDLLRAANVDTEVVLAIKKPLLIPYKGKFLTQDAFKDAIFADYLIDHVDISPSIRAKVWEEIHETNFYIIIRATQVNERLSDFLETQVQSEFELMLSNIFRYINERERHLAKIDPNHTPVYLDVHNPDHVRYYFTSYLPTHLGENLAKMHNLGLSHGYLHSGNISGIGGVVDDDSIRGQRINSEEIRKPEDFLQDIVAFVNMDGGSFPSVKTIIQTLQQRGFIPADPDLFKRFKNTFDQTYLTKRFIEPGTLIQNLPHFVDNTYMDFLQSADDIGMSAFLAKAVMQEAGLDLQLPEWDEAMLKSFVDYRRDKVVQILRRLKPNEMGISQLRANKKLWHLNGNKDQWVSDYVLMDYLNFTNVWGRIERKYGSVLRKVVERLDPQIRQQALEGIYKILAHTSFAQIDVKVSEQEDMLAQICYQLTLEEIAKELERRRKR